MSAPSLAAIALAATGALLLLAGLRSLWRARVWSFTVRTLGGLLLVTAGVLVGALAAGIEGYRALTREVLVARVTLTPTGPQRFDARFAFPDSQVSRFELVGDEIYVDARILKWTPRANLFGLHTMFELDRVAGRYRSIDQERTALRTVHPLGADRPVDLFALRRRFAALAPLFDAEYGSASFAPADRAAELDLYVSTSGLLFRPTRAPG